MSATTYPLAWPEGWPRNTGPQQSAARFKQGSRLYGGSVGVVTFDGARRKLYDELARLGARDVVLSTNVPLRGDGEARADAARYRIDDPGAAVYFTLKGKQLVMAGDRFDTPAANLRSLGLAIEGLRQLERHGGGTMMDRAFTGFASLPPPRTCWQILELKPGAGEDDIRGAFRTKAMQSGAGGNVDMAELVAARDRALKGEAA